MTQGVVAFAQNVRWFCSTGFGRRSSPMFVALAAGALLAIGSGFISYTVWETGRICGAPFPVATPKASALGWELSPVLPELPPKSGCWREIWRYPLQLFNVAFAFALPQIGLWIWAAKSRALPMEVGWSQRRWWDILFFLCTVGAIAPYIYFGPLIPRAWMRLPTWTSVIVERVLLSVPPALILVAWCVASSWAFQPRITKLARSIWALALMVAVVGFVPWWFIAFSWGLLAPMNFQTN